MPPPYDAPGRCIYCGQLPTENDALTEEHIIPRGLGGRNSIPHASCADCQLQTTTFETQCIRCMFYSAKGQFKIPGRKSGRPPSFLRVGLEREAQIELHKLHVTQHPSAIFTFDFRQAGVERGEAPSSEFGGAHICITPLVDNFFQRVMAIGGKFYFDFSGGFTSLAFGRMVAKICHAYAVSELGIDGFEHVLTDGIRHGEPSYLRHYLGSEKGGGGSNPEADLHEIAFVDRVPGLITVRLRLFAKVDTPIYYVVVGTPRK